MAGQRIGFVFATVALVLAAPTCGLADESAANPAPQDFAVHGQLTVIDQGNLAFTSPYAGTNSLPAKAEGRETADVSLDIGLRPWGGGEFWVEPEFDQGFGLHDTTGLAGFSNGEGAKVGRDIFYLRVPRLFLRQTIDLSGEVSKVDADLNQLGGTQKANRLVLTIGKFGVTDVFDTNAYAHDPKHDFLNWTAIDAGTFDYAADAWGYTVGAAVEWYQGPWTLRAGLFDLSQVPNGEKLDPRFGQFQIIGEAERRYAIAGQDGAIKLTGFLTRGRMARFDDAIALGEALGKAPDVTLVRRYRSRPGVDVNLQQALADGLGVFARAGWAQGDVEPYEFTDVDRTISGGVSLSGKRWGRPDDTFAIAGIVNGISKIHQAYLADGGLGILVGDGRLPHPGTENIIETYYAIALAKFLQFSLDYQFVDHPAYNTDRGPVSIFAGRVHAQF
ncbi:MAG TPA: carbohydrate porin [Caulobacteraceae bacterium]